VKSRLVLSFLVVCAVSVHARQVTGVCLSGQVIGDEDKGLGGAGLKLRLQGSTTIIPISSDVEGRFSLAKCAPGWYDLTATHIDYPTRTYGANDSWSDGTPLVLGRTPLTDLKFRLLSAGVITGVVKKANGDPIAGVKVSASLRAIDSNGNVISAAGRTTVTDGLGQYRLAALPPGSYLVQTAQTLVVQEVGYPAKPHAQTFHPSAVQIEDARRIVLLSGQTVSGADIVPQPEPPGGPQVTPRSVVSPGAQATEARAAVKSVGSIVGSVSDSSGAPATDFAVVAFPADRTLWSSSPRRSFGVRPANTGEFRILNVPPGEYRVAVVKDVVRNEWLLPDFLEGLIGASTAVTVTDNAASSPLRLKIDR